MKWLFLSLIAIASQSSFAALEIESCVSVLYPVESGPYIYLGSYKMDPHTLEILVTDEFNILEEETHACSEAARIFANGSWIILNSFHFSYDPRSQRVVIPMEVLREMHNGNASLIQVRFIAQ